MKIFSSVVFLSSSPFYNILYPSMGGEVDAPPPQCRRRPSICDFRPRLLQDFLIDDDDA
jgi:hypothetical protein